MIIRSNVFILLITLFLVSCGDEDMVTGDLVCVGDICLSQDDIIPDCIDDMIEDTPLLSIKAQELNGELHYWINTGANAADGDEDIVDNKCDKVCYYGGWLNPDCIDDYQAEWTTLNPK